MSPPPWKIEFYTQANGRCPARDFLDSLQPKDRVRVDRLITLLGERGIELRRPYVDQLRDGVWELRAKVQAGQVRLLYFFFDRSKIVIAHGVVKKGGPVLPREIDNAIARRADYSARHQGE